MKRIPIAASGDGPARDVCVACGKIGRLVVQLIRVMPNIKAIEEAVQALPPSDLAEFRRWFAEFDSAAWDRQIEADVSHGKLDALLAEAEEDFKEPPSRTL